MKWDGFRAILRTCREFRVRSRRGWNMTELLPELEALPVDAVLDGELVALGEDEWPDFPSVCGRLLNGNRAIPLIYIVFDVLELAAPRQCTCRSGSGAGSSRGSSCTDRTWRASAVFDDGEALFAVAQERGLEGVVAKRLSGSYRPGERGWVKVKNRCYWRCPLEVEAGFRAADRASTFSMPTAWRRSATSASIEPE